MNNTNNKGFTLVELLAIIVILAIILVVTVPAVFSAIESSRKKSLENSAKGLADWINKTVEIDKISGSNTIDINELSDIYSSSRGIGIDPAGTIASKINTSDYVFYDEETNYYRKCWEGRCYSNISYDSTTKKFNVLLVVSPDSSLYVNDACDHYDVMWASSNGESSWTYVVK